MTRRIRLEPTHLANWNKPVAECEVADHRYTDDHDDRYEWDSTVEYKAWKAAVPYHDGDVVWCEDWNRKGEKVAKRAIVLGVFVDGDYRERTGDRRPKYRIAFETAAGKWARVFSYTHPGFIQRGYQHHEAV